MEMGLAFWIIMLFSLIFALYNGWPNFPLIGGHLLTYICIALLGWKVFGPMLK